MQRLHPYALVAAAFLAALSAPPVAHAQQYREPLGSRCYNFDFGSNYGWDRYTNLCNENITVALIFPHGGRFDVQLRPGQSDGTGHSRSEYANMGQLTTFVAPMYGQNSGSATTCITIHDEGSTVILANDCTQKVQVFWVWQNAARGYATTGNMPIDGTSSFDTSGPTQWGPVRIFACYAPYWPRVNGHSPSLADVRSGNSNFTCAR